MLPDPHGAAPAGSDEDNWSWLITFSDLVLQLFGFAIIVAVGGAASHAALAPAAPAAVERRTVAQPDASARAASPETPPALGESAARDAAALSLLERDALPTRARDAADAVPARASAPAQQLEPAAAPVAAAARSPHKDGMVALGRYLAHLAALQPTLAATVTTREEDVLVQIGDLAGFEPGSATPAAAMRPLLAELRALIAAAGDLHVEVSGHTDDRPISTPLFPSNLELSLARASRVAHDLAGSDPALAARISAAGFGEQRPVASNADAQGRAKNRRVEIRLSRAG